MSFGVDGVKGFLKKTAALEYTRQHLSGEFSEKDSHILLK